MSFFSATFFSDEFFNTVDAVVDTADYALSATYGLIELTAEYGIFDLAGEYGLIELTAEWRQA